MPRKNKPKSLVTRCSSWHRLLEKREHAKRPFGRRFLLATAAVAVGALCLILSVRRDHGSERMALNAETLAPTPMASAAAALPVALRDPQMTSPSAKPLRAAEPKTEASAQGIAATAEGTDGRDWLHS